MSDVQLLDQSDEWLTYVYAGALYKWMKRHNTLHRYFRSSNSWGEIPRNCDPGLALTVELAVLEVLARDN